MDWAGLHLRPEFQPKSYMHTALPSARVLKQRRFRIESGTSQNWGRGEEERTETRDGRRAPRRRSVLLPGR